MYSNKTVGAAYILLRSHYGWHKSEEAILTYVDNQPEEMIVEAATINGSIPKDLS